MKPRITRRDDPLPPFLVLVRVEEDPYQSDHPGIDPLLRRVYGDGSRDLFFGDYRIHSVRREDIPSTPNHPYAALTLDDGISLPLGRISISEYRWLYDSIRGPQQ